MKKYVLEIGEKEYRAEVKTITAEYAKIEVDGNLYHVKLKELGRKQPTARPVTEVAAIRQTAHVPAPSTTAPAPTPAKAQDASNAGDVTAPLPGLILEVKVKEGEKVKAGQDLLVMEAMKMENQVQAPHDGTVGKLYVKNGDSVAEGDLLVHLDRSFISTL